MASIGRYTEYTDKFMSVWEIIREIKMIFFFLFFEKEKYLIFRLSIPTQPILGESLE